METKILSKRFVCFVSLFGHLADLFKTANQFSAVALLLIISTSLVLSSLCDQATKSLILFQPIKAPTHLRLDHL